MKLNDLFQLNESEDYNWEFADFVENGGLLNKTVSGFNFMDYYERDPDYYENGVDERPSYYMATIEVDSYIAEMDIEMVTVSTGVKVDKFEFRITVRDAIGAPKEIYNPNDFSDDPKYFHINVQFEKSIDPDMPSLEKALNELKMQIEKYIKEVY